MFATLIYHQFFANLALIYLNPNEVMRLTAIFTEKNLKIFVTLTWHNRVMGCFVCGIAWRGRNDGYFGIINTLFCGRLCWIKCLLCVVRILYRHLAGIKRIKIYKLHKILEWKRTYVRKNIEKVKIIWYDSTWVIRF